MGRALHHIALPALLLVLAAAAPACRPAAGTRTPPPRPLAEDGLEGLFVGVARDEVAPGIRRSTMFLIDLRPDKSGRIAGRLELRGALGAERAADGTTVPCAAGKPRVAVNRRATIEGGRLSGRVATLPLQGASLEGPAACAGSFPLAKACTVRQGSAGALQISCGGPTAPLRLARLTGTWVYDEERADRSGDTVVQRLRIHLRQSGTQVTGVADDIRVHVSGDGQRYRCNGRLRYDRQASHRLRGELRGRDLQLKVESSVAKRGPCQGDLTLPPAITGEWKPLEGYLLLKLGDDERTLWRRPPPPGGTDRP